jgi:perosamine synthetase
MNKFFIPVNEPLLEGNEKKYLNECIDTGWVSSEGPFVNFFEESFAKRVDRKFGIAVSSGTAALDIAVEALGLGPGDEVIMPTFTIISCVHQIVRSGATPVVIDSNPVTWNMDVSQIESKITKRTKAIMVVHIYGLPVDMDPILDLAKQYDLKIIEDAAEVIGQTYRGKPCGSFGDISIFSFYPNKLITTGEGGMVLMDDEALVEKCHGLRNLCFQKKQRFVHDHLGWNYRMTNMQAAIGLAQLEQLDKFIKKKREMGKSYTNHLNDVKGIQLPLENTNYAENIYWIYGIVLDEEIPLDSRDVMNILAEDRIGTRPFFWPMHEQPVFKKMGLFNNEHYPVAERIARRGFYIPSGLALNESEIKKVAEKIINLF